MKSSCVSTEGRHDRMALLVLHPLEIVSVANENLGERVGSLAAEGDAIIAAPGELITRAFG